MKKERIKLLIAILALIVATASLCVDIASYLKPQINDSQVIRENLPVIGRAPQPDFLLRFPLSLNPPGSFPWKELSPRATEDGFRGAAERFAVHTQKTPEQPTPPRCIFCFACVLT